MKAWLRPGNWIPLALVFIWGLAVLLLRQDTLRETAFTLMMFVGLASSLNIILGYTGYVSFGHIVFMGLGGYTGFYLVSQQGWPLYLAPLAGGLLSACLAGLLGAAVLRLRGAYFALATNGINEAARAFVSNFSPFGGATGLFVNFQAYEQYGGDGPALWLTFTLLWLATMAVLFTSMAVKSSRFGLGLMAIREDEDAAMVMGVKAPKAKTLAFAISAFFPGVIGTKTTIALAVIDLLDAYPALILCPPHLVPKWIREAEEVIPGAKGRELRSSEEVYARETMLLKDNPKEVPLLIRPGQVLAIRPDQ